MLPTGQPKFHTQSPLTIYTFTHNTQPTHSTTLTPGTRPHSLGPQERRRRRCAHGFHASAGQHGRCFPEGRRCSAAASLRQLLHLRLTPTTRITTSAASMSPHHPRPHPPLPLHPHHPLHPHRPPRHHHRPSLFTKNSSPANMCRRGHSHPTHLTHPTHLAHPRPQNLPSPQHHLIHLHHVTSHEDFAHQRNLGLHYRPPRLPSNRRPERKPSRQSSS